MVREIWDRLMCGRVVRYDLDRVCYFEEYNKAYHYGEQNIAIPGVSDWLPRLEAEKDQYIQDITAMVAPEKELERKKYHTYQICLKAKQICIVVTLGLLILNIVATVLGQALPPTVIYILFKIGESVYPMIFVSLILLIVDFVFGMLYNSYVRKVSDRLGQRSDRFIEFSRKTYEEIDQLYLCSLEPAHREMVLMNRRLSQELTEQRKEMSQYRKDMVRLERERNQVEREHAEEIRQLGKTQGRLLEIEEERERRRMGR